MADSEPGKLPPGANLPRKEPTPPIVFAYWNYRGKGEHLKLLIEYLNIAYTTKVFTSQEQWDEEKSKLNCVHPVLPYIQDGDKLITDCDPIIHHLCAKGRRPDLLGRDPEQIVLVRQLRGFLDDFVRDILNFFSSGKSNIPELTVNTLMPKLEKLSVQLGKQEWLAGELTYVDFYLAELLQHIDAIDRSCLAKYATLADYSKRFEELPAVKTYRNSKRAIGTAFLPSTPSQKDIVNKLLTNDEEFNKIVKVIFENGDQDNSGKINMSELYSLLVILSQRSGMMAPPPSVAKRLMKSLDTNRDGELSQKEFGVFVRRVFEGYLEHL